MANHLVRNEMRGFIEQISESARTTLVQLAV